MNNNIQIKNFLSAFAMAALFVGALAAPELAFAQTADGAKNTVKGFFDNLNSLLNIASIAIVTIAVIFAGYQIAFAHKRISDVMPVLLGGFLIGAAAQLAKMVIPNDVGAGGGSGGMAILVSTFQNLYA
ncbi:TrbC/VirB2 family protein [Lysobacter capsici]|jgi:type IV secretion system protein VirB2|uniref:TrbC/VirB2 family protein n=1 Tax=Lysobacter capsici TaxID=435897 RepID=UPI000BBB4A2F|nr:TrbC/VirB2 family protein [Lysobacter capsici]ATE71783.1 type VI secretion protein [Lysobacter capsici]UOF17111.1 TrbC/VirB2 family protein [Lysobacter capsici]